MVKKKRNEIYTIGRQPNSSESCNPMRSTLPKKTGQREFGTMKAGLLLLDEPKVINHACLITYPSKQEEAVRSHWSATRVASQA